VKATSTLEADWQRIWISTRQQNWNSLAIVPSDATVETTAVAEALAATGRMSGERPVNVLNARGTHLTNTRQLLEALNSMTSRGEWVIVPIDPIADNPSSVPIVQATSAALLVVSLGESLLASARSTIAVVGRAQFLGSLVLRGRGKGRRPSFHLPVALLALACMRLLLM
jgi:hypothetical protein